MDDLISRAAATRAAVISVRDYLGNIDSERDICIEEGLYEVPAVDAVPVVRCKYCKHRPVDHRGEYDEVTGFAIEFSDDRCPCKCEDGWYNWYPQDDWFCANGERRDDDA